MNYIYTLQKLIKEYNNTKHSHHNFKPNEIWKPTRDKMLKGQLLKKEQPKLNRRMNKDDKILYTAIDYAKKSDTINLDTKTNQVGEEVLPVGLFVRLSQKAYSNKVREVLARSIID